MLQARQDASPAFSVNCPSTQLVQTLAPDPETLPRAHAWQTRRLVAPSTWLCLPGGHSFFKKSLCEV